MKMTQAWGWLAVGVLAAGLNASYHDGGLRWVHRITARVQHNSAAVLDLASGRTDQFLAEARFLKAQNETASCRFAGALAQVQTRIAHRESAAERFDLMSAREDGQFARLEANRARMEAQIAVQTAHLRIATANFAPVALKAWPAPVVCPHVRVNIPKLPMIKMPLAPQIHIETTGTGPV
jgi:hypothetical protein